MESSALIILYRPANAANKTLRAEEPLADKLRFDFHEWSTIYIKIVWPKCDGFALRSFLASVIWSYFSWSSVPRCYSYEPRGKPM